MEWNNVSVCWGLNDTRCEFPCMQFISNILAARCSCRDLSLSVLREIRFLSGFRLYISDVLKFDNLAWVSQKKKNLSRNLGLFTSFDCLNKRKLKFMFKIFFLLRNRSLGTYIFQMFMILRLRQFWYPSCVWKSDFRVKSLYF